MTYTIGTIKAADHGERINYEIARIINLIDLSLVDMETPSYNRLLDLPIRITEFNTALSAASSLQTEVVNYLNSTYGGVNAYQDIVNFKTAADSLKSGIIANASKFILSLDAGGNRQYVTALTLADKNSIISLMNAVKATVA